MMNRQVNRLSDLAGSRWGKVCGSWPCHFAVVSSLVLVVWAYSGPSPRSELGRSGAEKPRAVIRSGDGHILSVSWSPDGKALAAAGSSTSILVRDSDSGRVRTLEVPEAGGRRSMTSRIVAFSPDGRSLAVGDSEGLVEVRDVANAPGRLDVLAGDRAIEAMAWSPDGKALVLASAAGGLRIWEPGKGRVLVLSRSGTPHAALAWSPDGRTIASAGSDGIIRPWDAATGAGRPGIRSHECCISGLAFLPGGATVAAASIDGPTRMWDLDTGKEQVAPFAGPKGDASLSFSPDGGRVATSSREGSITIRDVATGAELKHLRGHDNPIRVLAWSPDGRTLASAGYNPTAMLWDTSPDR